MKPRTRGSQPENGITINLKVSPGAKENAIAGFSDDRLRVRVKGKAVDGKANEALVQFLSELFGVAKSSVAIVRGPASPIKTIAIKGDGEFLRKRLSDLIGDLSDSKDYLTGREKSVKEV